MWGTFLGNLITFAFAVPSPAHIMLILQCSSPMPSAELFPVQLFQNNSWWFFQVPVALFRMKGSHIWLYQGQRLCLLWYSPKHLTQGQQIVVAQLIFIRWMNGWVSRHRCQRLQQVTKAFFQKIIDDHKLYFPPSKSVCQLEISVSLFHVYMLQSKSQKTDCTLRGEESCCVLPHKPCH